MTTALLAGIVAGLGIAMPVGAIATLLALLSARHGFRVGAAAGLGAATVDAAYATVALAFGALVAPVLVAWDTALRWAAAGVLVVVAAMMLRPALRPGRAGDAGPPAVTTPRRAYATFVGLTAVNPATVVYFAALTTGGAGGVATSWQRGAAFVVGACLASAAWQLVVAGAGHGAGRALTGPRGRRWTAIVGAAIVTGLALHTALGL